MSDQPSPSPHIHRAAGRVAGRAIRRNRVVNASLAGGRRFLAVVSQVAHALFLETMGLFFLFFTLTGGFATYRAYRAYRGAQAGVEPVILGVLFTLLFLYFAVSSFWRAQKRAAVKEAK
ncbi:MAG TPA: hypothetical protein VMZ25_00845 [Terriglobales bacterium]|nr:hypothetical protein [Terriglobales bacterium]